MVNAASRAAGDPASARPPRPALKRYCDRIHVEMALANPHFRETRRWMDAKVIPFLQEIGLVGGAGAALWRRAASSADRPPGG